MDNGCSNCSSVCKLKDQLIKRFSKQIAGCNNCRQLRPKMTKAAFEKKKRNVKYDTTGSGFWNECFLRFGNSYLGTIVQRKKACGTWIVDLIKCKQ